MSAIFGLAAGAAAAEAEPAPARIWGALAAAACSREGCLQCVCGCRWRSRRRRYGTRRGALGEGGEGGVGERGEGALLVALRAIGGEAEAVDDERQREREQWLQRRGRREGAREEEQLDGARLVGAFQRRRAQQQRRHIGQHGAQVGEHRAGTAPPPAAEARCSSA